MAAAQKPISRHLMPPPPPPPSPPSVEFEVNSSSGSGGSVAPVALAAAQLVLVLALIAIAANYAVRQFPDLDKVKQWGVRLGIARQHRRVATSDSMEEDGRGTRELAEDEDEEDEEWAQVTRDDEETRIRADEVDSRRCAPTATDSYAFNASAVADAVLQTVDVEPAAVGADGVAGLPRAVEEPTATPAETLVPVAEAAVSFSARRATKGVRFSLPVTEPSLNESNLQSPGTPGTPLTPTLEQAVATSRELLLQRPESAIGLQMDD